MDIYPNNTTAQYVTKLPKHIELTGDWSVSLKEISIPKTLVNIGRNTHTLRIVNRQTGRVEAVGTLATNMYVTIGTVLSALNKHTRQKYSITFRNVHIRNDDGIPEQRVRMDVGSARYGIRLNARLSELLGFGSEEREFGGGQHVAENFARIPGIEQMHNLYVYCDILENVIVGDSSAPLLRIVELTKDIRDLMMHTMINSPLFVPVQKKSFDTISIWIMTNLGEPAPFPSNAGTSHVVLEFKKPGLLNSLI